MVVGVAVAHFGWSAVVSVFSLCFLVSVWYGIVACVYAWVLLCGLASQGFDLLVDLGLLIVVDKVLISLIL